MTDIATVWSPSAINGDWQMNGPALLSGNDLETAVIISLFTDRRAQRGDVIPDNTNDPRGWWGDNQVSGNSASPIGSRLWLLARSTAPTQRVLNQAVTYAREALQWLITDGIAAAVDVEANWNAPNFLALKVTIRRTDGTITAINYPWAWDQIQ